MSSSHVNESVYTRTHPVHKNVEQEGNDPWYRSRKIDSSVILTYETAGKPLPTPSSLQETKLEPYRTVPAAARVGVAYLARETSSPQDTHDLWAALNLARHRMQFLQRPIALIRLSI
jgi:hypothetical protein